ncbi:IS4 family transposase [Halalkalibaculum sp. DA3122]|uniref:IS4 family transposase n=1 Tax=Halalkalibaculum sp. DA3122 TaxID=3373607 RepID=UPI003753ECCB
MSKHTYFTGQPVLAQIIHLIPRSMVHRLARRHGADRYCKSFFSWDHLIAMLYAHFSGCGSLREVITGLLAAEGKLRHLGLTRTPRRSTLSDANNRRPEQLFGDLYHQLAGRYFTGSPDSRSKNPPIYIADSTTISLFSDVMATAGRPGADGRRKGGVKAHTLIRSDHNQPEFVVLTPASRHDTPFLRKLKLPKGSIICFDKGYVDYSLFAEWSTPDHPIGFVSRLRSNAAMELLEELPVSKADRAAGVLSDQRIMLGHTSHKQVQRFQARLVCFRDSTSGKEFRFVSNLFTHTSRHIADIYRQRWQIEGVFKRIKGAWPLRYFLGDSPNAIKIQIWCALIADLLIQVLQRAHRRRWSYANLRAMIRLHCFSYVRLGAFLADPVKALLQQNSQQSYALSLFPT